MTTPITDNNTIEIDPLTEAMSVLDSPPSMIGSRVSMDENMGHLKSFEEFFCKL